jgi:hypothetical protein
METRIIYVPANHFGRNVLSLIWENVSCSMGEIRKVENALKVPITMPEREVHKLIRILEKFDLA